MYQKQKPGNFSRSMISLLRLVNLGLNIGTWRCWVADLKPPLKYRSVEFNLGLCVCLRYAMCVLCNCIELHAFMIEWLQLFSKSSNPMLHESCVICLFVCMRVLVWIIQVLNPSSIVIFAVHVLDQLARSKACCWALFVALSTYYASLSWPAEDKTFRSRSDWHCLLYTTQLIQDG